MRFYITYFNNIRNLPKTMLPISTAVYDPKWYHEGKKDNMHCYVDKRGVVNGFRCDRLCFPEKEWSKLLESNEECSKPCSFDPKTCKFMKLYKQHLDKIDFEHLINVMTCVAKNVQSLFGYKEELDIALIVHEPPTVKCAERPVLVQWFKEHGYELKEFDKYESYDTTGLIDITKAM